MTTADFASLLDRAEMLVQARMIALYERVAVALKAASESSLAQNEKTLRDNMQDVFDKYAGRMQSLILQGKRIPDALYNAMRDELQDTLMATLSIVYADSALNTQAAIDNQVSVSVDWAAPNIAAQAWSKSYTFDLVRGLSDTTQTQVKANIESLQKDISDFFEKPTTLADLRGNIARYIPDWKDRLGHVWSSAERAEMIATTEVTRASVQGDLDQVDYLKENYGIEMVPVWMTSNDEIVCPICAPRNNKRQGSGWDDPPPAHPRCRCAIALELA